MTSATSGPARYEPGQKTIWEIVFPAIGLYLAVILDLHSRPSPLDLNQWRTMAQHRLGRQQPHEAGSGDPGLEDGHRPAITPARLHLPQRPRQPILFAFAIGLEPMAPSMAPYRRILREHGFKASMSGKGNCYDNAAVETFFKTIKAELIWRRSWDTRRQAETGIFQYINGFYNPRRRHSALGGKSPSAFERPMA